MHFLQSLLPLSKSLLAEKARWFYGISFLFYLFFLLLLFPRDLSVLLSAPNMGQFFAKCCNPRETVLAPGKGGENRWRWLAWRHDELFRSLNASAQVKSMDGWGFVSPCAFFRWVHARMIFLKLFLVITAFTLGACRGPPRNNDEIDNDIVLYIDGNWVKEFSGNIFFSVIFPVTKYNKI